MQKHLLLAQEAPGRDPHPDPHQRLTGPSGCQRPQLRPPAR
jgi:hypothetical protein